MWLCRKTTNIYVNTEHFTLGVKEYDIQNTANIKIVALQSAGTFSLELVIVIIIVRKCDFFYYFTTINLETIQRISVAEVTCTEILHFK